MKKQQGFTLIELMIVVAIIGILAAIALPAYQDYTARAKVSEGLSLASSAKVAVTEYFTSESAWPATNASAGLQNTISSTNVASLLVTAAGSTSVITITYNGNVVSGGTLTLTPAAANGTISWACSFGAPMTAQLVPANCRQ